MNKIVKLYKINQSLVYAAYDLRSAIHQAAADAGKPAELVIENPRELTQEEMNAELEILGRTVTVRRRLSEAIFDGLEIPGLFIQMGPGLGSSHQPSHHVP